MIADAVMGIDNVLAIGGAAHGSILLIVLGLAISVPIIVWGSQLVIKLVDRFRRSCCWAAPCWRGPATPWSCANRCSAHGSRAIPATKLVAAVLIFSISLAPWYAARLSDQMKPLTVILPGVLVRLLAFEVAASVWKLQVDYLLATQTGEYILEAGRWLGWLPLVAGYLWVRERLELRRQHAARG